MDEAVGAVGAEHHELEREQWSWPWLAWSFLGAGVLVWRAGVGRYPAAGYMATRVVPALPGLPETPALAQYLLTSPLGALVAWPLQVRSEQGYVLLHAAVLTAFVVATGVVVLRRWGHLVAATVGVAYVGSSASVVCLHWLGSYDAFTVGLSSLLVAVRSTWLSALLGVALAFAAFEQAVLIVAILAVLWLVRMYEDGRALLAAAVGLGVGRLALGVWLSSNGVHHGRSYFLETYGADHFTAQFRHGLPWILATGLGVTLVLVAAAIWTEADMVRRLVPTLLLVAALVPVMVSEDQTRVMAVVTWPLVMVLAVRFARRMPTAALRRWLAAVLVLAVVVPGVVVWKGEPTVADHHVVRLLSG